MGTKIALNVRDVGGLVICIMGGLVLYFVPENHIRNNPTATYKTEENTTQGGNQRLTAPLNPPIHL